MFFRISRATLGLLMIAGCQPSASHQGLCSISPARSSIAWQYVSGAKGIRGRVLALGTLQPISGAMISAPSAQSQVSSDTAGFLQIALGKGHYLVQVRATGYAGVQDTINLPGLDGYDVVAVLAHASPSLLGCS